MQRDQAITCPTCGHENSANSVYCGSCGSRIDGMCSNCGTQNPLDGRYCNNCGAELSKRPVDEESRSPTAEVSTGTVDCPRCHHINEPGSRFCFNCGLPFDERKVQPTAWAGTSSLVGVRPAGFWVRFVALIIDSIIVTAVMAVIVTLFFDFSYGTYLNSEAFGAADIINIVLSFGYATVLVGAWSATVGKRAFQAQVLRSDGSQVGYSRALGREAAKVLSVLTIGIGFLMVAFREDKRGLHDLIADTIVVMR